MKTLEKSQNCGKTLKNNEGVPTKLLISQLPFIIKFKIWYLIKTNVILLYFLI